MFLWFFVFLDVLCCCLPIWNSIHLLQLLLTAFQREIFSISCIRDLRFSQTFYGIVHLIHASCSVALSCGRILKLVCLLSVLQCNRTSADSLPLFFPKCGTKVQVCCLSLACRLMLAFCVCSLPTCQNLLLMPPLGAFIGIWPKKRGMCGWAMQNLCGVHEPVGCIHCRGIHSGLLTRFLMESARQVVGSKSL